MTDDILILRRTAISNDHLACPIVGCPFLVEVPAIPVINDAFAGIFGMLSGRSFTNLHAELDASRAADTMREHLRIHPPEDWLTLLEHTVAVVEVRSDAAEVESLSGIAAAAMAARNAAEARAEKAESQIAQIPHPMTALTAAQIATGVKNARKLETPPTDQDLSGRWICWLCQRPRRRRGTLRDGWNHHIDHHYEKEDT